MPDLTRRGLIVGGGLLAAGCDRLVHSSAARPALSFGEHMTYGWQRLIQGDGALAREFRPEEISRVHKANGTTRPNTPLYLDHLATRWANWRLEVTGLVRRPLRLPLDEFRLLPQRTQITRHDCVEGWSSIGQWSGVPLRHILDLAGLLPAARYLVFRCMDNLGGEAEKGGLQAPGQYYESIDLVDAFHPQTLIATHLNGRPLPVEYGAPARLRVERQLGYKHAKYLARIEAVADFAGIYGGRGGFWEDRGYEWYAGI